MYAKGKVLSFIGIASYKWTYFKGTNSKQWLLKEAGKTCVFYFSNIRIFSKEILIEWIFLPRIQVSYNCREMVLLSFIEP